MPAGSVAATEAEEARRAADTAHKRTINNSVREALQALGADANTATAIVKAAASGKIPNLKVHY